MSRRIRSRTHNASRVRRHTVEPSFVRAGETAMAKAHRSASLAFLQVSRAEPIRFTDAIEQTIDAALVPAFLLLGGALAVAFV